MSVVESLDEKRVGMDEQAFPWGDSLPHSDNTTMPFD